MIQYKAEEFEIEVLETEESYTSKVDHLALETMEHHENYLGKRVKRGLFRSSNGILLNSDVNGSIGILRKVKEVSKEFLEILGNRGCVLQPIKLNC
jgi:putative transposase